ncbi:hypothetical protein T10_12174 [Trichinella papuae]|uniref:G-protein coupled receptors family 1 profile domain-containing protein n=1 Tax=Trichinella papuae TaxID=268474 RepID=A0A0V1MYN2_9BILA|nr:hypothetical protein T10_12174 [Trichinella papuae]
MDVDIPIYNWTAGNGSFEKEENAILQTPKSPFILRLLIVVLIFSFGSAVTTLGYATAYSGRLHTSCFQSTIYASECIFKTIHITCYAIGEWLITFSMFLMAADSLTTVAFMNSKFRVKETNINVIILFALFLSIFNVVICWIWTCYFGNVQVSACCYHEDVVPRNYYLFHYMIVCIFGYISMFMFITAGIGFRRLRVNSSSVRQIQMRREGIVLKKALISIAFNFVVQTLPCTAAVIMVFLQSSTGLLQYPWLFCIGSYAVYAMFWIFRDHTLHRIFIANKLVPRSDKTLSNISQY